MSVIRFRHVSEITADIKARLDALVDGNGPLLRSVVRFHGSKFETVRLAMENTVHAPGAIIQPGLGDYDQEGASNARTIGIVIYLMTEELVMTEDNEWATLADLAELVTAAFLPQSGTRATPYIENGVRYQPAGWAAIDFEGKYDVVRLNLVCWDSRQTRDDL